MKKLTTLSILFIFLLTACGASGGTSGGPSSPGNPAAQAVPLAEQLAVGILKLDGTPQAITSDQAKQLIPLWQVYKDLSSSDTSSQQEVDALVTQIQETLTAEQNKAITDMNLTRQDVFDTLQQLGISFGGGRQGGASANGTQTPRNGGGGGGFPGGDGGGFPGGGGGGGGQPPSAQQIATFQASGGAAGGGGFNRIPSGLLDAVIALLQKVAAP